MKVRKAVIPCAGFGTRFLPVTKVLAKELLPIVDTPALTYIVDEAVKSGIEEIMIVISPQKEDIRRLFEPNEPLNARLKEVGDEYSYSLANKEVGAKVSFVVQEKMDGNANAIYLCKKFANGEPFAVLFGDDVMYTEEGVFPVTKQLIDAYEKTGGAIVGCQHTSEEVARRCGVMIAEKQVDEKITKISGIIEKPTGEMPSNLVSLGRFVLPSDIFDVIKRTPKTNGEVYLTDAISILAKEKSAYSCIFDARRYDIGNKEGYLEATIEFALRDDKLKNNFKKYIETIR